MRIYLVALVFSYMLIGFRSEAVEVVVSQPGSLEELLVNYKPSDVKELTVSGTLNYEDLSYIHACSGIMHSVEKLDLSKINCIEDDENSYATNAGLKKFYFSSKDTVEYESRGSEWLVTNPYTAYHNRSLGGLLPGTAYKEVILPDFAYPSRDAFYDAENLESITFSGGPSDKLGAYAFYGCTNLKNVNLSSDIKEIPEYAFRGCSSISLPSMKPERIGEGAFIEAGEGISTLSLSNVTSMGEGAFRGSKISGTVDLSSLDTIPRYAFSETRFSECRLSPSLKYIGDEALYAAIGVFDLPESVEYVGSGGLPSKYVESVKEVIDHIWYVKQIAYGIEGGVSNIARNVIIREGTKCLSPKLFYGFGNESPVETISLPSSLKTIGDECFYGCKKLKEVSFPEGLVLIGDYSFSMCENTAFSVFPNSLKHIGVKAFRECLGMTEIILSGDMEIGEDAFLGCTGLSYIYYDVPYFDNYYESCMALGGNLSGVTKLTIGPNVRQLPRFDTPNLIKVEFESREAGQPIEFAREAFSDLQKLRSIVLPHTLKNIPEYCFARNSNLSSVTFDQPHSGTDFTIGDYAFLQTAIEDFVLPSNTISIGAYAFSETHLKTVDLPSTIRNIGECAFDGCLSEMDMFVIPDGIEFKMSTGWWATSPFDGMLVKGITIPPCVSECEGRIYLTEAKEIVFTGDVQEINIDIITPFEKIVFPSGLKSLKCTLESDSMEVLTIPDGVEHIDYIKMSNLQHLSLPVSAVSIGLITGNIWGYKIDWRIPENYTYEGTATDNTIGCLGNINSNLVFPEGVNILAIAEDDKRSSSLTSGYIPEVILPSTLTGIYSGAFSGGCGKITCYAVEPPEIRSNDFDYYKSLFWKSGTNVYKIICDLYVPAQSVEKYKNSLWNTLNIHPIEDAGIDNVAIEDNAIVEYYNLAGARILGVPSNGIYIKSIDGKASLIAIP